jgi:DNA-binding CsgD family transcriptional regulator
VLELLWVLFYCRIAQKYPVRLPLRSWLLTALPPLITVLALFLIWKAVVTFMEAGTSIMGLSLGGIIFLFVLNCFLFYWHITMLANTAEKTELRRLMAEAQEEASPAQARTNSNWSRTAGLSEAFVAKYQLSAQERRTLELAILGKTDKEIAQTMDLTLGTVKSYLHRVYEKTDTYGRGGVFSLIHG